MIALWKHEQTDVKKIKRRHCEVHQMIGNYMWDSRTNKSFDIGVNRDSLMPLWWNGSEPLWITLMKARRKVYMYYWPDHGMTDIFWMDKVIELNKYISLDDLQQVKDRGPVIYHKLSTVEHMTVYEKEAIPSRFYYKKGKFVSPLTLVADEGWFITEVIVKAMPFPSLFKFYPQSTDFKSNFRAAPIRSVDVYNIMCNVAGITPLPNNGSWSR
ncbi:hypothetical protein A6R68_15465, partial [Neotoma lepida]